MLWLVFIAAIVTGYVMTALFYMVADFINDAVEEIFE